MIFTFIILFFMIKELEAIEISTSKSLLYTLKYKNTLIYEINGHFVKFRVR